MATAVAVRRLDLRFGASADEFLAEILWGNSRRGGEIGDGGAGARKIGAGTRASAQEGGAQARSSGDGERARRGKNAEGSRRDTERGWMTMLLLSLLKSVFLPFFFLACPPHIPELLEML